MENQNQNQKSKRISVFTILVFVFVIAMLAYAILSAKSVTDYIGEMVEYGQLTVKDNMFDIISYYFSSCATPVIYAIIMLAIWWTRPRTAKAIDEDNTTDENELLAEGEENIEVAEIENPEIENKEASDKATIVEETIMAEPVEKTAKFENPDK